MSYKITTAIIRKADKYYDDMFCETGCLSAIKSDILGKELDDVEDEISAGQYDCLADAISDIHGVQYR